MMNRPFVTVLLFCFFAFLFWASGSEKTVLLKSRYQETPHSMVLKKSYDEVWTKLVDYITEKGLSVKTVEKESGIISTDKTNLIRKFTYELSDGSLQYPWGHVVIAKTTAGNPKTLHGDWVFRVKPVDNGVQVTIMLANQMGSLSGISSTGGGADGSDVRIKSFSYDWVKDGKLDIKSTGVFEREVEAYLNK